ncbi:MAG: FmdB family zinc ribbon protein [Gammaproteobacteria bacterium]
MPIYEYACSACGHHMEVMQSIKEAPLTQCPKCKKKKLQKLVSAAGFQLKGTGWYVTDFRDKGKPAKAANDKDEGGTAEKTDAKDEKKDTAKPDTGSDTKKSNKPDKKKKKKAE